MDASNRLNFSFDSGRGISLDYAGSGMDRGLPDFSIQLPVVSTRSDISLPSCVSTNVFSQPLSASREGDGYHFRPRPPPTTRVEFLESDRKRDSRDQRSTAMQWSNISKEIDSLLKEIQSEIHVTLSPEEAKKSVDLLLEKWDRLEGLRGRYLAGINERKRLEHVQERYSTLKREVDDIINECEGLFRRPDPRHDELGMDRGLPVWDPKQDDKKSVHSVAIHVTKHSEASSVSSQKKSLKRALVFKMKLDFARARAKEDAEAARVAHEYKQRMELRRLEEEATLAELKWKIEMDNLTESKLPPVVPSTLNTSTFIVNKKSHSTPVTSEYVSRDGFNSQPSAVYVMSNGTPQSTEPKYPAISRPSDTVLTQNESSVKGLNTTTPSAGINSSQSSERVNFGRSQTVSSMDQAPRDHVAAMWKAQLLSRIKPTQFSGNPAEFPFFREQVRTHLESDLLTDAQQVEYLPKFVAGEALEVVKRNRGCTFNEIMKTLEERFGQAVRVTQACVEELASGPKLGYGDNTGLLNFSENLNAATRILKGDVEREASVATNLRRIVNRLPNDLILKWQTVNYELVKSGRSARLKDVAEFVHKQASIRNDPVFGLQTFKRENKNTKLPPKLPVKNTTISTTGVDHKTPASENTEHFGICKSSKRHKLQECPIIKQCEHVAVRRQYAASCGFCFNYGLERPGHGSGSCPDPPACSVYSGRHIPLLHSESNYGGRRSIPRNNRESNDKSDKPLATPKSPNSERGNVTPTASGDKSDKSVRNVPISSAAVATVQAKVLLNVIPVVISVENGNTVSTYAFLDSGSTDTLIEQDLADHLGIQGTPVQIGINTISSSDNVVESKRVSFTLTSVDSSGESIDVSEAYVLPNLNQSRCTLPEQIDTIEYPHSRDVEFPEVDIKRVSILVGNNIPYAHLQKEVRVPEDKKKGLYGCRYPLGWCVCGPYGANCRQGVSANFFSIDPEPRSLIEKFWNLKDYGTLKSNEKPLSVEHKIALKIIENTTRCVDGRYEVGMLWKETGRQFPNNVAMAKHRLECLRRRLTKPGNEEMPVKYREAMDSYISGGFARKLSEEELNKESKTRWYLPHHPVTSPTKPGKVRIVFGAAAECEGTSLNKNLLTGPDVANNLVGVLLRFYQGKIAFAADIEKMFHQIRVREEDQESLRFFGGQMDMIIPRIHT